METLVFDHVSRRQPSIFLMYALRAFTWCTFHKGVRWHKTLPICCIGRELLLEVNYIQVFDDLRLYSYYSLFKAGNSNLRPGSEKAAQYIITAHVERFHLICFIWIFDDVSMYLYFALFKRVKSCLWPGSSKATQYFLIVHDENFHLR